MTGSRLVPNVRQTYPHSRTSYEKGIQMTSVKREDITHTQCEQCFRQQGTAHKF